MIPLCWYEKITRCARDPEWRDQQTNKSFIEMEKARLSASF